MGCSPLWDTTARFSNYVPYCQAPTPKGVAYGCATLGALNSMGRLKNKKAVVVVLVLLLRFGSRLSRFCGRCLSGVSSSLGLLCLLPPLFCLPLLLLFWLVRALLFVRFPRPPRPRGFVVAGVRCGRWLCVSAERLPSCVASCFCFSVVPAVVSRRSGAVLWFWVWVSGQAPDTFTPSN